MFADNGRPHGLVPIDPSAVWRRVGYWHRGTPMAIAESSVVIIGDVKSADVASNEAHAAALRTAATKMNGTIRS